MSIETRDKIIASAQLLFIEQGYTATSMRQIAEHAGIGKATIYHHFADKESIVLALLSQNAVRMEDVLTQVRAELDPRRRIQVAAEASIHFLYNFADILQIVRREIPDMRDRMGEEFKQFFKEYTGLLVEAIRKGTEIGIYRRVDAVDSARVLMTMIQGTFAMAFLVAERTLSAQQVTDSLLEFFFKGIETE